MVFGGTGWTGAVEGATTLSGLNPALANRPPTILTGSGRGFAMSESNSAFCCAIWLTACRNGVLFSLISSPCCWSRPRTVLAASTLRCAMVGGRPTTGALLGSLTSVGGTELSIKSPSPPSSPSGAIGAAGCSVAGCSAAGCSVGGETLSEGPSPTPMPPSAGAPAPVSPGWVAARLALACSTSSTAFSLGRALSRSFCVASGFWARCSVWTRASSSP